MGSGQWPAKLLAIQGVLACCLPAEFRRAHGTPADPVTGLVQAAERPFQPLYVQAVFVRYEAVIQHDLPGDGGAQGELTFDLRGGETVKAAFHHKAGDLAVQIGPHHRHIGNGRIGNPGLGAVEQVATVHLPGAGAHGTRIGTVIRLGETEAADPLAGGQFRQVFLAHRFTAKGMNREHYQ